MNIIAVDQERHGLDIIINGKRSELKHLSDLKFPKGEGFIVADANVWAIANGLSVSQYAWDDIDDRTKFIDTAASNGYACLSVSTKYANNLYLSRGYSQADAIVALYEEAVEQISATGRFDSGKPVRESRGDVSFGQRDLVVKDFLRMQNSGGYESEFVQNAIDIAWNSLDKNGKQLFNLKITKPETNSPNRLCAVLVCTHDPNTGERREYNGRPWGTRFIVRRVIGLNGTMRGTGSISPGNPMRAVLRILGRRWGDKINKAERSELDRYVKILIREFQKHPQI